jgi:hypothetical protein
VDRHCATRPGAVLARLMSDYGDPLRSRYEHVDCESTGIDCRKIGGSPQPYLNGVFSLALMATRNGTPSVLNNQTLIDRGRIGDNLVSFGYVPIGHVLALRRGRRLRAIGRGGGRNGRGFIDERSKPALSNCV